MAVSTVRVCPGPSGESRDQTAPPTMPRGSSRYNLRADGYSTTTRRTVSLRNGTASPSAKIPDTILSRKDSLSSISAFGGRPPLPAPDSDQTGDMT